MLETSFLFIKWSYYCIITLARVNSDFVITTPTHILYDFKRKHIYLFTVYNPPDHVQQPSIYTTTTTPNYTASWSTVQPQTPTTVVNTTINCWSLTSSPPPPHQISAQSTPDQSPTHQIYQHNSLTNLTNLTYPSNYYGQDIAFSHYQTPEYIPLLNSDVNYPQVVNDRSTPTVYQEEVQVEHLDKVEFEEPTPSHSESPNSNTRNEWSPQNHIWYILKTISTNKLRLLDYLIAIIKFYNTN